jgi:hypothetical protein
LSSEKVAIFRDWGERRSEKEDGCCQGGKQALEIRWEEEVRRKIAVAKEVSNLSRFEGSEEVKRKIVVAGNRF